MTPDQLKNWFTYHSPQGNQPQHYEEIREAGLQMALVILRNCPPFAPEIDTAFLKIRDAVMWANAAIACNS